MNYRFTLSHPSFGSQVISQPDGWSDAVVKLERHPDFHSLVEYFEGSFIFYGSNGIEDGGVEIIKDILAIGINEELIITIEITENDTDWDMVFTGTLDLSLKEHMPMNKIKVPIVPDDFWTKFVNRFDTPVDIQSPFNLDDDEYVTVPDAATISLPSQAMRQKYSGMVSALAGASYNTFTAIDNGDYLQVDFDITLLDEIQKKYSLPVSINPTEPVSLLDLEYEGEYTFTIKIVSYILVTTTSSGLQFFTRSVKTFDEDYIDYYFNVNGVETAFTWEDVAKPASGFFQDGFYTVFEHTFTGTLDVLSSIKVYGRMNHAFSEPPGVDAATFNHLSNNESDMSFMDIVADTIYLDTTAEAFLLHDVGASISDRITGQEDSFYSEYLGSSQTTARTYDEDGCGWIYALLKGLQLRQYTLVEKPFFLSFKDWWEGINPILNLSLSYETIEYDTKVIRVEEKEYQYDSSSNSVEFDNIRDIVSTFDNELHFKKIEQGYSKWESEGISGIDDPQTKHTYASIFSKIGITFTNFSRFMAASLGIEITRRTTREKSADYKHDNETFIIAINPETEYGNFVPELDENFSSVTNLLNSETRYNIRLTPKRNLTRWMNYVAMGLQSYLSSSLKFVRGEGNYDTTTTINPGCGEVETELSEKADLPIAGFDPLFIPEVYKMVLPMGWDAYRTIQQNKKKSIGVSQTESGHTQFFIKTLEFNPFAGQAVVHAWPKVHMDLDIIDIAPELVDCVPPSEPVPSYRITEEGDFRITEDNQFRII